MSKRRLIWHKVKAWEAYEPGETVGFVLGIGKAYFVFKVEMNSDSADLVGEFARLDEAKRSLERASSKW